jgi:precorrin-6A/cobalt-precorrin-6A reductase
VILLLGGTAEAGLIAKALSEEGREVLLSTATTIPPRCGLYPGMKWRKGELDAGGLENLIREWKIDAVIDATHPYAASISTNAQAACRRAEVPYLAFERPEKVEDAPDIYRASDHHTAAGLAFSFGLPVLLTIGVRNLPPYVAAARGCGTRLVARVLDHPASMEACLRAGLAMEEVLCANGPFSVPENSRVITSHDIGVVVTKDSGQAGGVNAKIQAARNYGCQIVVVDRPPRPEGGYSSIPCLIEALRSCLGLKRRNRASQKFWRNLPGGKLQKWERVLE